jgi:hypothetical protein
MFDARRPSVLIPKSLGGALYCRRNRALTDRAIRDQRSPLTGATNGRGFMDRGATNGRGFMYNSLPEKELSPCLAACL